ncbi:hypothetical protein TNCT_459321 [Trichonephila clavata]|uniref:Uncharacterized protein n=1 Tax=Trichonephila clavata TaxID=2740835 RepID=A0A8X6LE49_TRICU|nr:hypothetical protein TNCT_459321 [Trichonephila clavata]
MKTRCLKSGEPHRTNDCPITKKIEDSVCINCHQHGNFTSDSKYPKFPKLKPKKGDTIKDKNKSQLAKYSNLIPGLSFEQAHNNNDPPPLSNIGTESPKLDTGEKSYKEVSPEKSKILRPLQKIRF